MKNSLQAIGICGSLRKDSYNRKLLQQIMNEVEKHGIGTRILSAAETELPFVNEDLETKPLDAKITDFRQAISKADFIVICSPEYNGSPSAILKNAIDWATRPPGNVWENKVVLIASASPGSLGGARGLIHLRTVLSGIKSWVIPEQIQCPEAHHAFTADGTLQNPMVQKQIAGAIPKVISFTQKLLG